MCSNNSDAIACLDPSLDGFRYGIYVTAVPLTFETNMVKKYVYSHFWGLQVSISHFVNINSLILRL
jgi:cyclic nucleotide gated channel